MALASAVSLFGGSFPSYAHGSLLHLLHVFAPISTSRSGLPDTHLFTAIPTATCPHPNVPDTPYLLYFSPQHLSPFNILNILPSVWCTCATCPLAPLECKLHPGGQDFCFVHCSTPRAQTKGTQFFSIKGQPVNILCLAGHTVTVTTTQLCYSPKAVIDVNK